MVKRAWRRRREEMDRRAIIEERISDQNVTADIQS